MIIKSLRSDHGVVFFDAHTGWVTHSREYLFSEGLPKVVRVDIDEWRGYYGYHMERHIDDAFDIMSVGYWYETDYGEIAYESPNRDYCFE